MISLTHHARRVALAAGTLAGTLALAAPALAVPKLDASVFDGQTAVSECAAPALAQPFAAFGDPRSYALAPNGGFADATGGDWLLAGGASVVTASRPVAGTGGVLNLPAGAKAMSPLMCVDLDYPTARVWMGGTGSLDVRVVYPDSKKGLAPKSVGTITGLASGAWKLSSDVDIKPQLGGKLVGWRRVAFQLLNTSKTGVQVDDVFVDPRMR